MVEERDFIRIIREQSLKFQENRRGTLAFSREYDILMMVKDSQNSRRNDMRLSDSIETFIKTLLAEDEPEVELKRNELAEYFGCAPSQINYVLATRFSPDHGYLIESRRGGGGYIRIVRIVQSGAQQLMYLINERIGDAIGGGGSVTPCAAADGAEARHGAGSRPDARRHERTGARHPDSRQHEGRTARPHLQGDADEHCAAESDNAIGEPARMHSAMLHCEAGRVLRTQKGAFQHALRRMPSE